MWPTGDFGRFKHDILQQYSDYDEITFGILIADPRQAETNDYIFLYLNQFHKKSGKLFDFFIPGYWNVRYNENSNKNLHEDISYEKSNGNIYIHKNNISYQFNPKMYDDFCEKITDTFGIPYTFNPMLVLMSMKPGHMETVKYITIELDDNEHHSARRAGQFFMELFNAIESDNSLEHIHNNMVQTYTSGNLLDSIINSIGVNWLTEIRQTRKNLKQYRIKNL